MAGAFGYLGYAAYHEPKYLDVRKRRLLRNLGLLFSTWREQLLDTLAHQMLFVGHGTVVLETGQVRPLSGKSSSQTSDPRNSKR